MFSALRMTNYNWRVSWFWPQLNLCAWTPPFLWRAQPIVCSTTNRKWTLAQWNGTESICAPSGFRDSTDGMKSCQAMCLQAQQYSSIMQIRSYAELSYCQILAFSDNLSCNRLYFGVSNNWIKTWSILILAANLVVKCALAYPCYTCVFKLSNINNN